MRDDTILCRNPRVTVGRLRNMLDAEDRDHVAEFVHARFTERYFNPIEALEGLEATGFAMMALSCLVVESLESYHCGWATTRNKSEQAFRQFFTREREFQPLSEHAHDFFVNVRCGIHHQGETVGGWRVWKFGPLFNSSTLCVNAKAFRRALSASLEEYVSSLSLSADPERWVNCESKLRAIMANC